MTLVRALRRLEAVGIGLFAGVTIALLVGDGNYVALGAAGFLAVLVFLLARAIIPATARADLYLMVGLALSLRYAVAVTINDASLAAGRGGFVTGDDANYADLSWGLAQAIRGQAVVIDFEKQGYLIGTFVYLETAIFAIFGPNVVVVEMVNAAVGAILSVFAFDLSRRMFGDDRGGLIAATLCAFFPSLVLWTSLNLKESLTLVAAAVTLWLLLIFYKRPTPWLLLALYLPLLPMESLRLYIFVGLVIVLPIGVALASFQTRAGRIALTVPAIAFSVLLLGYEIASSAQLEGGFLARLEQERGAMTVGARTGFGAPVIRVYDGATYVVSSSSAITVPPDRTPRVVVVQPPARLIVGAPAPSGDSISVVPGDTVVIGPPGTTPAPSPQQMRLTGEVNLVGANDNTLLIRTLIYLPVGAAFAFFAPVPGSGTRVQDLLPAPEMLVWYAMLAGAAFTLWRWRARWRAFMPTLLFVGGTMFVLSLAEGNVGTLYRHRAMVIPFVGVLASPAFALLVFGRGRMPLPVLRGRPSADRTSA
jgi:Dolichyl-phosphate-mannose-protein mannosyltransferase